MRQRGFGWIQLVAVLAAAAALVALVEWGVHSVDQRGYARGVAEITAKREAADRVAQESQRAREVAVQKAITTADEKRQVAEVKAKESETKRQEAIREARRNRVALAVLEPASADRGAVANGIRAPVDTSAGVFAAGSVRLTWEFVREYDSAWTGSDGKPLFNAVGGSESSASGSPYGLTDIIDIHGENAKRCSEDRLNYQTLIDKVKAAQSAWGQQ